jgi:hypothetical protein
MTPWLEPAREDRTEHGVFVISNFKGPEKDGTVYESNICHS